MINLKIVGAAALLAVAPVLIVSTADARPGGRGGGGFSGFHGGGGGGFRGGMGGGGFRGGMAAGGVRGGMSSGGFRGSMAAGGFRAGNFAARPGGFTTVPRVGNVGAFAGGAAVAGRPAFSGQRWAGGGNWNRGGYGWRNRYWRPGYGVAAGLAAGAIGSSYYYGSDPYYYDNYDSYAYDTGGDYDDGQYVAVAPGGSDDSGYCAQRYRSYDPSSGTYLGYDGLRHPCP